MPLARVVALLLAGRVVCIAILAAAQGVVVGWIEGTFAVVG